MRRWRPASRGHQDIAQPKSEISDYAGCLGIQTHLSSDPMNADERVEPSHQARESFGGGASEIEAVRLEFLVTTF